MAKNPLQLDELVADGIIDAIHTRLLTGKEASVFVVERDGHYLAAKVYKARNERSFKNVAAYLDGRNQTRNTRDKRAKNRKTKYGRELMEQSWRDMEFNALQRAFNGGVRVPEPHLLMNDVLLMDLVLDEDGHPAPRLADFDLPSEVAGLLLQEVYLQVRRLLQAGLIHGDLSAFNVLVAAEGLTLIDLPQVIDAAANSDARNLLVRDMKSVVEHMARFDDRLLRFVDCGEALWRHYERGTLDEANEPQTASKGRRRGKGRGRRGQGSSSGTGQKKSARPRRSGGPRDDRGGGDNDSQGKGHGKGPSKKSGKPGGKPSPSGNASRAKKGGHRSGNRHR